MSSVERDLGYINKMLKSNSLDINGKKCAFFIANSLIEANDLKVFINYCLSDKVNLSLLSKIEEHINNGDLFLLKIKTILSVGLFGVDNAVLFRILDSNLNSINYVLITRLFESSILKSNVIKRDLLFNSIMNNDISLSDEYVSKIFSILESKFILELDDNYYNKLVDMLLNGDNKVVTIFLNLIDYTNLSIDKRRVLIDYYQIIIGKHIDKYSNEEIKKLLDNEDANIFNVGYSYNLIIMSDKEYKEVLGRLVSTDKIFSCVKVMGNPELDMDRRDIAINLINGGSKNKGIKNDYKGYVADAANSIVLSNYSLSEYTRILTLINNWCLELESMRNEGIVDNRVLCASFSRGVIRLLNAPILYNNNNLDRLYMTIEALLTVNTSEYLVNKLVDFACSKYSIYYSDIEYMRILGLIKLFDDKGLSSLVISLFTNSNIPYMEDKSSLFEVVQSQDKILISTLTKKLDEEGKYRAMMDNITEGIDEETINLVIGPNMLKVRCIEGN